MKTKITKRIKEFFNMGFVPNPLKDGLFLFKDEDRKLMISISLRDLKNMPDEMYDMFKNNVVNWYNR